MSTRRWIALAATIVAASVLCATPVGAAKPKFSLTSSAFGNGATIPVEYTCKGAGMSPPLTWKQLPKGTKTLALIMEDPDTPIGTFVHWVVANFKPKPPSIAADSEPANAFGGVNGAGRPGWIPPCPPSGVHHYIFTLYALDKKVTLPPGATAVTLRRAMTGKILGRARLTGLFGST
jgi:Raf kinase inhibitor-like YbhB/YbcL family protein